MNLLVTNTRNSQAYTIIRALRPHAKKIVATMEGDSRIPAWLSHAARSRLVDRRFFTPLPAGDWRSGRIQRTNTEAEERYVQSILTICEGEEIDTIFPSFDPHVYVFSKNKERFERLGIVIPVPDYETVRIPLDKYRAVHAAQAVGFPCPKTYLAETEVDLKRIANELGFPLVIKPRFTAGGRGTETIKNLPELLKNLRKATAARTHMIQEYIPGKREEDLIVVLDAKGRLKMTFADSRDRHFYRLHQNFSTVGESLGAHPYIIQAARLGQTIGWWGSLTVQVKIDSRDGLPKFMEANPRPGYVLWLRVAAGINEPLMCVKIAKGEEVEAAREYPAGTLFLYPVEDLLALGIKLMDLLVYKLRTNLQGRMPVDSLNPPPNVKELIRCYKKTYLNGKKKIYNLYFTYFFQDPLASILWFLQAMTSIWRAAKQLGK